MKALCSCLSLCSMITLLCMIQEENVALFLHTVKSHVGIGLCVLQLVFDYDNVILVSNLLGDISLYC